MEENQITTKTGINQERNPDGTFVAGISGNPGGRPKGTESFSTIYKKALKKIAESKKVSPEDFEVQLVQQAIIKGFNGDKGFYSDTIDRVYGKALQSIDHTTNGKELPTPILSHVFSNDSTQKDSEVKEEN
jgi:hypothetical protein